jgi:hypothetical protein
MKLTDEMLDSLLDADENTHANPIALFERIQERRRTRAHAIAKQTQPAVGASAADWAAVVKFARTPLRATDRDRTSGEMDHLLVTVQDSIEATAAGTEHIDDFLFALLRVWRKAWALNEMHLGPIEGVRVMAPTTEANK